MSKDSIEAVARDFERFIEKRDAKGLAGLYTENGRFLPPDFPTVEGRAEIEGAMQGFFDAGYKSVKLTTRNIEFFGDTAVREGTYTSDGEHPGGGAFVDVGKFVEVWRKQPDGSWLIGVDIFNRDAPLA